MLAQFNKIKRSIGQAFRFYRGQIVLLLHNVFSTILPKKFLSFHLRPKYAKDVKSVSARILETNKFAVIIQGPIAKGHSFTVETIKLYQKIFRGSKIILSTWKNEDKNEILAAQRNGAEVILNEKPVLPGYYNINLQLKSTQSALNLASSIGIKYCFKTRSDFRFYRYDLFDYFIALIKAFPLKDTSYQRERLITTSFGTCKYRLYGITDFMMFGNTADMLSYWGAPFYEEGIKPYIDPVKKQTPPVIGGIIVSSEIYLTVKYLERLGIKHDWTIQQYWNVLRDYFCVADGYSLDLFFNKYFKLNEYRYTRDYSNTNPRAMEFADWLQLYIGSKGKWENVRYLEEWAYENGAPDIVKL